MTGPAEVIRAEIEDPRTVFVFPSEVAARFWMRRAFSLTARRTLPQGRFIAWDRFKRETLRYTAPGRAADDASRTLFIAGLLEENRVQGIFRRIIPPEHRGNSPAFLRSLKGYLPVLHRLLEAGAGAWALEADKRTDLLELLHRYRRHLALGGLYEPTYEQPVFEPGKNHYRLFHMEILEDFPFLDGLFRNRREVRVQIAGREVPPVEPRLEVYETSEDELTDRLARVAGLLDGGVPAEEIALTVAGLDEIESSLSLLARRYEIPLTFRRRRPVAWYPQGRIFRRMAVLVESGFGFQALRDLLLSPAVPWSRRWPVRELVRFGVEHRVFRNHSLRGQAVDLWEHAIGKALTAAEGTVDPGPWQPDRLQSLRRFYRVLKEELERVHRASSLPELKDRLFAFTDLFFDRSGWDPEEEAVYRFALSTLNELITASEWSPAPVRPFEVWLEYMEEKRYVRQEDEPGIPVYAYPLSTDPLSAGIQPEHHFILNASQAGTRRVFPRYPFLAAQEAPEDGREADLSEPTLRLYARSGKAVCFSYGRLSLAGVQLPPAFFVSSGSIEPIEPAAGEARDLYAAERRLWQAEAPAAAGAPVFTRLYSRQKEGFHRAQRTGLLGTRLDLRDSPLGTLGTLERILSRLRSEDGMLAISPTSLELYSRCSFQFLFQKGLGLEEIPFSPVMWEDREFGEVMHRAFQRFYRRLQAEPLRMERREHYRRIIREETDRVLSEYEAGRPVPLAPIWEEKVRQAHELAEAFLLQELEEFPGQEVLATEDSLEALLPEEGIRLVGKIDRISRIGGRVGLVDYKKRSVPRAREIFGEEATSFQIPFYLYLMSQNGWSPEWAAYYSIEARKYRYLFHPEKKADADAGTVARAVDAMLEKVRGMGRRLREGDFRLSGPTEQDTCRFCALKGLCRSRFIPLG